MGDACCSARCRPGGRARGGGDSRSGAGRGTRDGRCRSSVRWNASRSAPVTVCGTPSNAAANLLSRSWIRNRIGSVRSTNVSTMFRACWVTQFPVGFGVMPARCTCRVASSINTSTYKRPNNTVSTVKKSQAMIPLCLRAKKRTPRLRRPPRRRVDAGPLKDRPDGAGRDPDAESGELTLDPPLAPTRILPRSR